MVTTGGTTCSTCTSLAFQPWAAQDCTGDLTEAAEYRRWESIAGLAWAWTPLRFPGQYYDAETDLFENWNRYYDPSIGRYLQPEPMLSNPSVSWHAANRLFVYAYVANNPLVSTDETGELQNEGCKNLPKESDVEFLADDIRDSCLKGCVLERLKAKSVTVYCTKSVKDECAKHPDAIAWAPENKTCKPPGKCKESAIVVAWCDKQMERTSICGEQAMVHELAHLCGWGHGMGGGVPGDDGSLAGCGGANFEGGK